MKHLTWPTKMDHWFQHPDLGMNPMILVLWALQKNFSIKSLVGSPGVAKFRPQSFVGA